jgi:branched-subunit amino acid ABC-type transport system permease component
MGVGKLAPIVLWEKFDEITRMIDYLVSLGIFTTVYALFSLGLNLQWGFTGLINFGQVAFVGLGTYATILLGIAGVPLPLCVLAGALLAAILGLLIGISTLRLREDYLAIVTIGVAEVLQRVAINEEWLTRGTRGVYGYPLPLKDLQPTPLIQGEMSAALLGILGIIIWRLWQWLQTKIKTEQRPAKTTQWLGLLAYFGAVVAVEYSLWHSHTELGWRCVYGCRQSPGCGGHFGDPAPTPQRYSYSTLANLHNIGCHNPLSGLFRDAVAGRNFISVQLFL